MQHKEEDNSVALVSYYRGYEFYDKQIKPNDPNLDIEWIIEGIRSAQRGDPLLLGKDKLQKIVFDYYDKIFEAKEHENLHEAEKYLSQIAKDCECIELIPEKLYIKNLHQGYGEVVKENDIAKIAYQLKILKNGQEVDDLQVSESTVSLGDMIPGLAKGTEGMRIGEKRKIIIHPELAYGSYGGKLDPNQLVIVEVELLDIL